MSNGIKGNQIDGDLSVGRNVSMGGEFLSQGHGRVKGNLKVDGWLFANNVKVANKGFFTTVEELESAYPKPMKGWWAVVGTSVPGQIYAEKDGKWVATGGTGGEVDPLLEAVEMFDVTEIGGRSHKLTKMGQAICPVTTTTAVVDPNLHAPVSDMIDVVNVSVLFPKSGVAGSDKFTFEEAIRYVPVAYRRRAIKCAFYGTDGKSYVYEYQGGVYTDKANWLRVDGEEVHSQRNAVEGAKTQAILDIRNEFGAQRVTPDMLSESTKQLINASGGGTITNLPDDEDLTSVGGVLKLADKAYNPAAYSGKGRIILRKNIVAGKNVIAKETINEPNTIYEIKYDFDLQNNIINLPFGCTLKFEGGSISNGTIVGDNTTIISGDSFIFSNVKFGGSFKLSEINPYWFVKDIKSDIVDITEALQCSIDLVKTYTSKNRHLNSRTIKISLPIGHYKITNRILSNATSVWQNDVGFLFDFNDSIVDIVTDVAFEMLINTRIVVKNVTFRGYHQTINPTCKCFIIWSDNQGYCYFSFHNVKFLNIGTCVDTVSFEKSRSTTMEFQSCVFRDSTKHIISHVDILNIYNCNFGQSEYNTNDSYIECRGTTNIFGCIFNPDGKKIPDRMNQENRWIDYGRNNNQGNVETSILNIIGCRFGNEIGAMTTVYNWSEYNIKTIERPVITIRSSMIGYSSCKYKTVVLLKKMPMGIVLDSCLLYHTIDSKGKFVMADPNLPLPNRMPFANSIIVQNITHEGHQNPDDFSFVDEKLYEYMIIESAGEKMFAERYKNRIFNFPVAGIKGLCHTKGEDYYLRFKMSYPIHGYLLDLDVIFSPKQKKVHVENYPNYLSSLNDIHYKIKYFTNSNKDNVICIEALVNTDIKVDVLESRNIIWYGYRGLPIDKIDSMYNFTFSGKTTNVISTDMSVVKNNLVYGEEIFCNGIGRPVWKGWTSLIDADGNPYNAKRIGTKSERPAGVREGFVYKDTNLNKWIVWNGSSWENFDGSPA